MVTGGARGIGLASALELARLGADIALFDIAQPDALKGVTRYPLASRDDLGSAERDVSNQKVRALAIAGDTRRLEDLEQAVSQTVQTLGSLDIVVANVRRRML